MLTVLSILAISWCALVAFAVALARSSGQAEQLRRTWPDEIVVSRRSERLRRQDGEREPTPSTGVRHVPA
jgi:hypothetical protein